MVKTWHTGSRQYTSNLHTVTTDIYVFILLWHQGLYPVTEQIGVKCVQPEGDNMLHVDACCTSPANQVLLKESKGMEITGHKIRTVGMAVNEHPPATAPSPSQVCMAVWQTVNFSIFGLL